MSQLFVTFKSMKAAQNKAFVSQLESLVGSKCDGVHPIISNNDMLFNVADEDVSRVESELEYFDYTLENMGLKSSEYHYYWN